MSSALIVAAGRGVRMGADRPKQYLTIGGLPILTRTLRAFDNCERIQQIVVTVPEQEMDRCRREIIAGAGLRREPLLVPGGPRRQDSVFNGLQRMPEEDDVVLIHDGVRPLVTGELIERCIDAARRWGACIPVVPVTDTLIRVDPQNVIIETVARESLCMAQTPQAFRLSLIRKAHQWARQNAKVATDDASLVEQMGGRVHTIPGDVTNIKITTAEDLQRAEAYLHRQWV
ncbi:2-C-methyl-D-erythritol 4-phosphate cytidylyltransferase [Desulfatitalea alkaliphila]|uniref:2-C-methyl-D-erythritol 4-phosphate cytidylyltransferase n=1 Tax=Desulfatitalea alkaliphila TaxID=2929485 RepID=A0AA41UIB5_9BACT|nr:2-C-methyl-D-erythritol 4-phosphate cytidylyltransferase [Desulfatitalea alkaliphila]MCJ8500595.1 2-C-methyl-D-erythritol 4-phosphate cytidylyltransferase [Desulfatitalea alkaliphila]